MFGMEKKITWRRRARERKGGNLLGVKRGPAVDCTRTNTSRWEQKGRAPLGKTKRGRGGGRSASVWSEEAGESQSLGPLSACLSNHRKGERTTRREKAGGREGMQRRSQPKKYRARPRGFGESCLSVSSDAILIVDGKKVSHDQNFWDDKRIERLGSQRVGGKNQYKGPSLGQGGESETT